jgi:hypothetical protein
MRTAAGARLMPANLDQVSAELVAAGLLTAADVDACRAAIDRPERLFPGSLPLISVWGRRGS